MDKFKKTHSVGIENFREIDEIDTYSISPNSAEYKSSFLSTDSYRNLPC